MLQFFIDEIDYLVADLPLIFMSLYYKLKNYIVVLLQLVKDGKKKTIILGSCDYDTRICRFDLPIRHTKSRLELLKVKI